MYRSMKLNLPRLATVSRVKNHPAPGHPSDAWICELHGAKRIGVPALDNPRIDWFRHSRGAAGGRNPLRRQANHWMGSPDRMTGGLRRVRARPALLQARSHRHAHQRSRREHHHASFHKRVRPFVPLSILDVTRNAQALH